jgi:hypothetical protein
MAVLSCLFIAFEFFQFLHLIKGTYDIKDIFFYFLFGGLAIIINSIFKNKLIIKLNKNED